mgnify:CR=1 FL=1
MVGVRDDEVREQLEPERAEAAGERESDQDDGRVPLLPGRERHGDPTVCEAVSPRERQRADDGRQERAARPSVGVPGRPVASPGVGDRHLEGTPAWPDAGSVEPPYVSASHDSHVVAPTARLTDRQREAVEAGLDLGYYDVPRTTDHEAVADALGCAPSTAAEHLRKAESKLLRAVVRGE